MKIFYILIYMNINISIYFLNVSIIAWEVIIKKIYIAIFIAILISFLIGDIL